MTNAQAEMPHSTRDSRQRTERKRPEPEVCHAGEVWCPLCQRKWNSPDRRNIRFCKTCRPKLPIIEMGAVVEDEFIYF